MKLIKNYSENTPNSRLMRLFFGVVFPWEGFFTGLIPENRKTKNPSRARMNGRDPLSGSFTRLVPSSPSKNELNRRKPAKAMRKLYKESSKNELVLLRTNETYKKIPKKYTT